MLRQISLDSISHRSDGALVETRISLADDEVLLWKQIVAKAAHDMRSPISAMRTAVEISRMSAAHPERVPALTDMFDKQPDDLTKQLEMLESNPAGFLERRAIAKKASSITTK